MSTQPSLVTPDGLEPIIVEDDDPTQGLTPVVRADPDALAYVQLANIILRDPTLSNGAVRLYGILAGYADVRADAPRDCWASQATLAGFMGCSVVTIGKYQAELVKAGIVTIRARYRKDGGRTSNMVILHDKEMIAAARRQAPTSSQEATPPLPTDIGTPSQAELATPPKQALDEREPREREPRNKERARPTSRLRPDWQPTAAHKEYALANRLDLTFEAMKFRNHAEANDRRQVSWDAAFSNWLLSSKRRAPQSERSHWEKAAARPLPAPAPAVSAEQVRAEQEEYQRMLDREAEELAEYQAQARRARKEAGL